MTSAAASTVSVDKPTLDKATLDKSLLGGLAYTGGVKWFVQLLTWGSTLVVARVLTPEDYGLVGMASIYFGLATLISEFGLGAAVIAQRELTDGQAAQLNTLALLIGLAACGGSFLAGSPLADFFGAPPLRGVVAVMSLSFVILAFQTIPAALLQKELRFGLLAAFEGCQAVVVAAASILLALLGFGYWTLVLGNLLGSAVLAVLVLWNRPYAFAWPRRRELKDVLTFSGYISIGRLAWYVQSNADFLVAGRVLGQHALGVYTIAWNLASVPVEKVGALAARVTPAFFAAVQTDLAATRRYLSILTEALASLTVPLAWGLALTADDVVLLLLGDKWLAVAGPLRLLGLLASIRPVVSLLPQILNVTGQPHVAMYNSALGATALPVAVWLGSHWGTTGIAAAWLLTYPVLVSPLYWWVFRRIHMTVAEYFSAVWPTLSSALLMAATVIALKLVVLPGWALFPRVLVEVGAGVVVYFTTLLTVHHDRIRTIVRVVRRLRDQTT